MFNIFHSTTETSTLSVKFNGSSYSCCGGKNNLFICGPEYGVVKRQSSVIFQTSFFCVLGGRDGSSYYASKVGNIGNESLNNNN